MYIQLIGPVNLSRCLAQSQYGLSQYIQHDKGHTIAYSRARDRVRPYFTYNLVLFCPIVSQIYLWSMVYYVL